MKTKRLFKNIMPLIMAVALFITALPVSGIKAKAEDHFVLNEYGVLFVSGNITRKDFENLPDDTKAKVKKIQADWDCVLPNNCEVLFSSAKDASEYKWPNLETIDLNNADYSEVTSMQDMFYGCFSVTKIYVMVKPSVTDLERMFYNCPKIRDITINGWNTSNVTSMSQLFCNCKSLKHIYGIENINTSKVSDTYGVFQDCSSLESMDLSKWDLSNVSDMRLMFEGCSSLKSVNMSNVDVSNVKKMNYLFQDCTALKELDLSSFNTKSVEQMHKMFNGCTDLTKIKVSDKWSIDALSEKDNRMFQDCISLRGGNGTVYNDRRTGADYAHIDKSGNPGYLTDVNASSSEVPEASYNKGEFTVDLSGGSANITGEALDYFSSFQVACYMVDDSVNLANIDKWTIKADLDKDGTLDIKEIASYDDHDNVVEISISVVDGKSVKDSMVITLSDAAKTLLESKYWPYFDKVTIIFKAETTSDGSAEKGTSEKTSSDGKEATKVEDPAPTHTVGEAIENGGASYTISSVDEGKEAVTYAKPESNKVASATIPDTITIDNKEYKVTEIAANAFKNNKKLNKITIGKNINKIGANAFFGCKNLKNIKFKTVLLTKKTVGKNAFKGVNAKAKAKVPKKVLKAYKKFLPGKGLNGKGQKITK